MYHSKELKSPSSSDRPKYGMPNRRGWRANTNAMPNDRNGFRNQVFVAPSRPFISGKSRESPVRSTLKPYFPDKRNQNKHTYVTRVRRNSFRKYHPRSYKHKACAQPAITPIQPLPGIYPPVGLRSSNFRLSPAVDNRGIRAGWRSGHHAWDGAFHHHRSGYWSHPTPATTGNITITPFAPMKSICCSSPIIRHSTAGRQDRPNAIGDETRNRHSDWSSRLAVGRSASIPVLRHELKRTLLKVELEQTLVLFPQKHTNNMDYTVDDATSQLEYDPEQPLYNDNDLEDQIYEEDDYYYKEELLKIP